MRIAPEGWPFIVPGWALVALGAWAATRRPAAVWPWGAEVILVLLALWRARDRGASAT